MALIVHHLEVFVLVGEDGVGLADAHGRVRIRFARQLLQNLLHMVVVDVAVAAGPDELPRLKTCLLMLKGTPRNMSQERW